ncbi:MAG: hypothetical protein KGY80_10610 [Candidatus Thorarchaeota archaeon]|nr:hypothetical protein [Candidatus Thorarchaeota archaeon]
MMWRTKVRVVGCCLITMIIGAAILIPYCLDVPSRERTKSGAVTFSSAGEDSVYADDKILFLRMWENKRNYTASGGVNLGLQFTSTRRFQNLSFLIQTSHFSEHGSLSIGETVSLCIISHEVNQSWEYRYNESQGWFGISFRFHNSSTLISNPNRIPLNVTLKWRWNLTDMNASGNTSVSELDFSVTLTERLHLYDIQAMRIVAFWCAVIGTTLIVIMTWKYQTIEIIES